MATRRPVAALKVSTGVKARAAARARAIVVDGLTLRELRHQCEVTQVDLAGRVRKSQAAVSKIERRGDLLISTLCAYLRWLGARCEVTARFSDGGTVLVKLPRRRK